VLFGLFVFFSATQLLLDRKPRPSRQMPGRLGQAGAGGVIGFVSGLVGAGGAFMSVPFMTWCNVALPQAVATSAALGFPIALANTAGYVIAGRNLPPVMPGTLGYLVLPVLAVIAIGSVSAAPWGARAAHTMDVKKLRRIFAVLLYSLGSWMLWKGLTA
jgi:uncharacterized membrane protein YfcA